MEWSHSTQLLLRAEARKRGGMTVMEGKGGNMGKGEGGREEVGREQGRRKR